MTADHPIDITHLLPPQPDQVRLYLNIYRDPRNNYHPGFAFQKSREDAERMISSDQKYVTTIEIVLPGDGR